MKLIQYLTILTLFVLLTGCSGGGDGSDSGSVNATKVNEDAPIAELQAAVAEMSVEDLKQTAEKYTKAVQAKVDELEPLKEKLAQIPMADKLGEEAKALGEEVKEITTSVSALKERLDVYVQELKKKGEDVSEFLK